MTEKFTLEMINQHPPSAGSYRLLFKGRDLLVYKEDSSIPVVDIFPPASQVLRVGSFEGRPVVTAFAEEDFDSPEGMEWVFFPRIFGSLDEEFYGVINYTNHILAWHLDSQYCGRCGKPSDFSHKERAKECGACGKIEYPRIFPAVITAITKGDEILLASSNRFPAPFYSVIAGYVEAGESLEECVKREVMEETGLEIKNIDYFGSQPWGPSGSLMVGFTCEYAGGELVIDTDELSEARWFNAGNLPQIPGKVSIAGQLIDWFVRTFPSG